MKNSPFVDVPGERPPASVNCARLPDLGTFQRRQRYKKKLVRCKSGGITERIRSGGVEGEKKFTI